MDIIMNMTPANVKNALENKPKLSLTCCLTAYFNTHKKHLKTEKNSFSVSFFPTAGVRS